jgi:hypothetical protein
LVNGLTNGLLKDGLTNGSRSGRSDGLADRTTLLGTVALHPVGVGGTFAVFGPFLARCGAGGGIRSGVFVSASVLDGRALVSSSFTGITTGLHTVDVHPLGVFGAFAVFLSSPSVTRRMSVFDTEIFSVSRRTGTGRQGVLTSADRAARVGTVGEHPVGVGGTLRRLLGSPSRTVTVSVNTFGFVGRAKLVVLDLHGGGGLISGGLSGSSEVIVTCRDGGTPDVGGISTEGVFGFGGSTFGTLGGSIFVDGVKALLVGCGVSREGDA